MNDSITVVATITFVFVEAAEAWGGGAVNEDVPISYRRSKRREEPASASIRYLFNSSVNIRVPHRMQTPVNSFYETAKRPGLIIAQAVFQTCARLQVSPNCPRDPAEEVVLIRFQP